MSEKPREEREITYVKCDDCARRGKPTCRKRGMKWSVSVIPGCMILAKDADKFKKSDEAASPLAGARSVAEGRRVGNE